MKIKSKEVAQIKVYLNKAISICWDNETPMVVIGYLESILDILNRKHDDPDNSEYITGS